MDYPALSRDFFRRQTQLVARELLGKLIVRRWRGAILAGRITETEGYEAHDAACHASRGRTKRTEVMFGDAGHAYVYLIYGMYDCLNFVTEPADTPAAVLIRSLEPLVGIAAMQRARRAPQLANLTTGPGKLTQALRITRALNGEDLAHSVRLWVADDGFVVRTSEIIAGPRIGVDYAGADALLPWRYYLKSSPYVSRRPSTSNIVSSSAPCEST